MNKIQMIIDFLFDQFILPWLPEGGKENDKEEPDGEVGEHS